MPTPPASLVGSPLACIWITSIVFWSTPASEGTLHQPVPWRGAASVMQIIPPVSPRRPRVTPTSVKITIMRALPPTVVISGRPLKLCTVPQVTLTTEAHSFLR